VCVEGGGALGQGSGGGVVQAIRKLQTIRWMLDGPNVICRVPPPFTPARVPASHSTWETKAATSRGNACFRHLDNLARVYPPACETTFEHPFLCVARANLNLRGELCF